MAVIQYDTGVTVIQESETNKRDSDGVTLQ